MKKEENILTEKLPTYSQSYIQRIVDQTYDHFLSGEALQTAVENKQTKLINLLLRLRDFATVVEVNWASKEGDTGRLLFMWKRWSVMGQGLKKLVHYSRHLPQLILLLEVILPPSLAKVVESTLLLCPSGREDHFVATDFYLEVQNFWLKYFYNHSGIGTNIERLRDVFSLNIPILKNLMHILNIESGMNVIQQSHKNKITNESINDFIRFAKQNNICLDEDKEEEFTPTLISDVYNEGIAAMKTDFTTRKGGLDCLKPTYMFDPDTNDSKDSGNLDDPDDPDDDTDNSDNSKKSNNSKNSNESKNSGTSNDPSKSSKSDEDSL
ncbi:hypothetical protein PCANC_23675 [Puccinia coronata f. sp. avenae]|uniref:DUF6589 domain-containing protein n=1 Tax=Puccinia coronata f. sp. avenae TaxID=200324 RepID=A0A2N5VN01_9BASI|nr:hypothetical protein PCANC_23675 [Puccinia coronata f. sp. avenae]PLW51347.1 hypothetical protein PCASD_01061 [Puccinia coronata f. sp. avenae]